MLLVFQVVGVLLCLVLGLAVMAGLGEVLLSSVADLSLLVDVGGMAAGGVGGLWLDLVVLCWLFSVGGGMGK